MTSKELKREQYIHIAEIGGYLNLQESDDYNNDLNRAIIKAFTEENGSGYMGNINFYGQKWDDLIQGKISCYEKYTGQNIYNFACAFIVSKADEELKNMIKEWNDGGDSSLVDRIYNRIEELNGMVFIWS